VPGIGVRDRCAERDSLSRVEPESHVDEDVPPQQLPVDEIGPGITALLRLSHGLDEHRCVAGHELSTDLHLEPPMSSSPSSRDLSRSLDSGSLRLGNARETPAERRIAWKETGASLQHAT